MGDIKKTVLLAFVAVFLGGCAEMISIGETKTFCAENGKDFSDAGLCDDPYKIYENAYAISKLNDNSNKENKCSR